MSELYPRTRLDLSLWGRKTEAGAPPDVRVEGVAPLSLEIVYTGYDEADSVRATIPLGDLPVDSRTIRDVLVQAWISDVESLDGEIDTSAAPSFLGFADKIPTRLSTDGDFVEIAGRDYAGVALDEDWGRWKVRLDRRLDLVLVDVLRHYPSLERLAENVSVRVFTRNGRPLKVPHLGSSSKRGKWFRWRADGNVWEAIGRLCSRVGWVAFFEGDQFVIRPGGSVFGGDLLETTRFIWGENLEELTYTPALTRDRIEGIEVVAWNTRTGKSHTIRHPRGRRTYKRHLAPASADWTNRSVRELAEEVFELFKRTQITGSLVTREMGIDGADLTKTRPGETIRIAIDPELEEALARSSASERYDALVDSGFAAGVAETLAANWIEVLSPWVVSRANHNISQSEGYRLELDLVAAAVVLADD